MMTEGNDLINRAVNTIRFLSADGVQKANSGHPGLPMGTAAIAYTIWMRHLKHNPANPDWVDRDRFILSGGHGSMMLYSLLHLTGYAVTMDDLMQFRQWGSITPGHPEYGLTPGVETTTGPLGAGFSNGVGMAIAEEHLASLFNQPEHKIVGHYVYAIVTDGDLMEGISSEAASFAGHQKLGKMIYCYDDNRISIDGSTEKAFTEDRAMRFEAYGWQVLHVADGNNVEEIDEAIKFAKKDDRPSLIICRTHIGYGMPHRQDTSKAHGEPPGDEELDAAKKNLGWPLTPRFFIPDDVLHHFRQSLQNGDDAEANWNRKMESYQTDYPEQAEEFKRRMSGQLAPDWDKDLPVFPTDAKGQATRVSSGKVINALAAKIPELVGGSADLTPSTNTWIQSSSDFQFGKRSERNFHFGVREHGMAGIINGMAIHKGLIPFGATFMTFSDYSRPAIRLSALSHFPSIWVFTHDSIGLGEDGPTHQPIEHLAALRAIPNLVIIRPGDANESREAWKVAIERRNGPTLLVFSRQAVPTLDRSIFSNEEGLRQGAYVLADIGDEKPDIILMATGSELSLIVDAGLKLATEGVNVRLVSFPSWELFGQQSQEYQDSVLLPEVECRLAVEAGVTQGWERWTGGKGRMIGINHYGASAPAKDLFTHFGFTVENVYETAGELLEKNGWSLKIMNKS
jgi:transketolase